MRSVVRAKPFFTPMHRDRLPACSCRHVRVDGLQRPSGRNASPQRGTPSTIMSPTRSQPGPWTEIRLGVRAHPPLSSASTAPVKRYALGPQGRPPGDRAPPLALEGSQVRGRARTETQQHLGRLTRVPCTDKEQKQLLLTVVTNLRHAPARRRPADRAQLHEGRRAAASHPLRHNRTRDPRPRSCLGRRLDLVQSGHLTVDLRDARSQAKRSSAVMPARPANGSGESYGKRDARRGGSCHTTP
jgi:hypothetical protein